MRRRPPSDVPGRLVEFDPADWPGVGANEAERYVASMALWRDARDRWTEEHAWEGDEAWWAADHHATVAMPDEPWDPSKI